MSDVIDPNREYLPFGFCREAERKLSIIIPRIIIKIIRKYQIKYKILACGNNYDGQHSQNQLKSNSNKKN